MLMCLLSAVSEPGSLEVHRAAPLLVLPSMTEPRVTQSIPL